MWSPITAALHQPQLGPILVPFFLQQTRKKKTHIMHMDNGNCYVQNCALVTTDYPKHLSWLKTCRELKVFDCASSHWVFPASHYYPCHGQHLQTWVCHLSRNPGWFLKSWILSVFRVCIDSLLFFCFCVFLICIILIFIEKTQSKGLTSEKSISLNKGRLPLQCLKLNCFLQWPRFFCIQKISSLS